MTSILEQEIHEQPAVLRRLLTEGWVAAERAAARIRERAPCFIVLVARGSSDNAARYGQYLFGAANRLPVALATPSLFTLYSSPPRLESSLVLAVSQSGRSPDIVTVVEEGRRQGALTLALTNDPASPLAAAAEEVLPLQAGPERSVAATKTYTASLVALALLSALLAGDEAHLAELEAVPDWVTQALAVAPAARAAADRYREMEVCAVLSRGYNYATAFEIALKLKELAGIIAEPYSSADFQHGPVALVERGFPVLAVVPQGPLETELTGFLGDLRARGAELLVISALEGSLALAQTPLRLPEGVPEWLSPVVAVVPGQVLALELAQVRGLDPDHPRGLRKVTLTR
jgi:glucosamine--fructose-6-phosphate aminotransferase (isomerizing)